MVISSPGDLGFFERGSPVPESILTVIATDCPGYPVLEFSRDVEVTHKDGWIRIHAVTPEEGSFLSVSAEGAPFPPTVRLAFLQDVRLFDVRGMMHTEIIHSAGHDTVFENPDRQGDA